MEYTDKAAVQNYLLTNIAAPFDDQLTEYIQAMSQFADTEAGYPIYRNEETTRYYDGVRASELPISSVHTISQVTMDDIAIAPSTEYVASPYNNEVKRRIILRTGTFTPGVANIAVTGIHSRVSGDAVPAMLKHAVTVLVAGIINQVNTQSAGVQSEKVGEYQVTYRNEKERADFAQALTTIRNYRKITF